MTVESGSEWGSEWELEWEWPDPVAMSPLGR
jgi:hypothetical protein